MFVDLRTGRVTPATGGPESAGALAVAFSPDGRTAATAGADGPVTLWNPATGAALDTFAGHAGAANGIAFSPDGRTCTSRASTAPCSRGRSTRLAASASASHVPPQPPHCRMSRKRRRSRSPARRWSCATATGSHPAPCRVSICQPVAGILGCPRHHARLRVRFARGRARERQRSSSGRALGRPVSLGPGSSTNAQSLSFSRSGASSRRSRRADARDLEHGDRRDRVRRSASRPRRPRSPSRPTRSRRRRPRRRTTSSSTPTAAPTRRSTRTARRTSRSRSCRTERFSTGSFDGTLERWNIETGQRLSQTVVRRARRCDRRQAAGLALTSSLTSGTLHELVAPGLSRSPIFPATRSCAPPSGSRATAARVRHLERRPRHRLAARRVPVDGCAPAGSPGGSSPPPSGDSSCPPPPADVCP